MTTEALPQPALKPYTRPPEGFFSHLSGLETFTAHAFLLGERLRLGPLRSPKEGLAGPSLFLGLPGGGVAVLFRYGAVVVFAMRPEEKELILDYCNASVITPYTEIMEEEQSIVITDGFQLEGIYNNVLHLKRALREHFEIIAEVLARSVKLDKHEQILAQRFEEVKPVATTLIKQGKRHKDKELLRYIGLNLLSEYELAARVEVTEKPTLLWEHPELEHLYTQLVEEFELMDRQKILEQKLSLLSRTVEVYLDVLQHRHGLKLEWYIIILISTEIVLQLYGLFG